MPEAEIIPPGAQEPVLPDIDAGVNRMASILQEKMNEVRENMKIKDPSAPPPKPEEPKLEDKPTPPVEPAPVEQQPAPTAEVPKTPDSTIDNPPPTLSAHGKDHWNRLVTIKNKEIHDRQSKLEKMEAELKALKERKATESPELDQLKKQAEEMQSELERVALERSPKFRNYFDGGIEKQLKKAKAVAGEHGEEVAKLLMQPRSKERNDRLKEIQEDLGIEGGIIGNALAEITSLKIEREEQLAKHKENLALLRQNEEQSSSKTMQQRRLKADAVVNQVKTLPEFTATTDPEHQKFVVESLDFIAKANLGEIGEEDASLLPAMAMKGSYLQKFEIPKLKKEIETLKARLTSMQAASPKASTGTGEAKPAGSGPLDPFKSSFMGKFEELMGR